MPMESEIDDLVRRLVSLEDELERKLEAQHGVIVEYEQVYDWHQ